MLIQRSFLIQTGLLHCAGHRSIELHWYHSLFSNNRSYEKISFNTSCCTITKIPPHILFPRCQNNGLSDRFSKLLKYQGSRVSSWPKRKDESNNRYDWIILQEPILKRFSMLLSFWPENSQLNFRWEKLNVFIPTCILNLTPGQNFETWVSFPHHLESKDCRRSSCCQHRSRLSM